MIPKIIHYSWFSGEEYPASVKACMDSWHRFMPDYEFVLWDRDRAKEVNSLFLDEALQERKWAFAADVVRCYAVSTYGGIWLDSDVEVFRSFDEFLSNRMFIGKEGATFFNVADEFRHICPLTAHCFGAEVGHPFIRRCFDYYYDRHFITSQDSSLPRSLQYDMRILPEIMAIIASQEFAYQGDPSLEEKVEKMSEDVCVFPFYVFDLPRYHKPTEIAAIHYLHGGWVNNSSVTTSVRGFRKKDWQYYLYQLLNCLLKRRRLKIHFQSY